MQIKQIGGIVKKMLEISDALKCDVKCVSEIKFLFFEEVNVINQLVLKTGIEEKRKQCLQ